MVITQKALENFIKTPQHIETLTNQKITEIEAFEIRSDDPFVVIGKVLTRVDHPNSDHLNLTTVDVGHGDILNIVCGAKNVDAGQTVIVAKVGAILPGNFEIKEAVIRGEQSKGMICSLKELGFSDKVIPEAFKDGIYYFNEDFQPGYSGYEALGQVGFKMTLGLTPNRGDLLSVLGYAYDLSAMLNMKVQVPEYTFKTSKKHTKKVTIQSEACSKYMGRVFENVVIKASPWWLKSLLIDNDIRPINNVVDITNYVLLLLGTPLHTFDASKFISDDIIIRQAKDQEKVVTLDGQERTLLSSDLVISNGTLPVALAGVMGLENTMVTDTTNTLFLEAALFDPNTILETSKRLDLRSDSSLRFERGVGYDRVALGLDLATQLLLDLADATLIGETVSDERNIDKKVVKTSISHINSALGLMLSKDEIINYLMRLRFEVVLSNDDEIQCAVPYDRYDISIEADIVEEVGRIYGLDLIPSTPLKTSLEGKLSIEQKKTRQLEHLLTSLGFQQVITYSLRKLNEHKVFHQLGEHVTLMYPLSEDRKLLRQSLYGGMLDTLSYNVNRQLPLHQIFEIGHVFSQAEEKNRLSLMMQDTYIFNRIKKEGVTSSFYALKAIVGRIFEQLGVAFTIKDRHDDPVYHPYQTATIYVDDKEVGHFGTLHPNVLKQYDLKEVYAATLYLDDIVMKHDTQTYQPISKFPSVERDLAFMMPIDMSVKNVVELMQQTLRKYLVDVYVFDVYQGEHVKEGHQSVAFRMILNDNEKTLTNDDVEKLMKKVVHRCQFELKLEIR